VGLATHYLREGRIEEAEVLVRDALKIDDSDVEGNFLLGEILVRKAAGFDAGSPERAALVAEARKAFETSLANAPDDVASLLALGRLERAEGRPGLARSYYRRVVLQKRQSAEAHEALADLHEDSGELEHAVNNLLNLRMLAPERDAEISARLQRLYATLYHREVQRTPATRPAGEP
jgi:uncharacterized protein HemY